MNIATSSVGPQLTKVPSGRNGLKLMATVDSRKRSPEERQRMVAERESVYK